MSKVTIPHNFTPRDYQLGVWNYMCADDKPGKRAVWVAHRRAGKDKTILNIVITKMLQRVGTYYYLFPTYKQGRQVIWEGIDKDGFKFMDHIPKGIIKRKNDTTMMVELVNGSIFQVIGTDNYNRIVGTNPVGLALSEFSLQDPMAWNLMRPILAENGGWAIFNFTPRGQNHGYEILQSAKTNKWYWEVLDAGKTRAIPQAILEQEKVQMKQLTGSDSLYLQEFFCDFNVPIQGAFYEAQISKAYDEGRITTVPYERELPVHTAWDLGVGDSTTIWFYQQLGREIRIIDYLEDNGRGLDYYIKQLQNKGYVYGDHYAPHDIKVREFGTGKTRMEIARKLGVDFRLAPQVSVMDGITAARITFDRCYIDENRCAQGLNALKSYHKEFDDKKRIYKERPTHDWSSHGADAFRYLALSVGAVDSGYYEPQPEYTIFDHRAEDPYE